MAVGGGGGGSIVMKNVYKDKNNGNIYGQKSGLNFLEKWNKFLGSHLARLPGLANGIFLN